MRVFSLILFIFCLTTTQAQTTKELTIEFSHNIDSKVFKLNTLKFYISNIQLLNNNQLIYTEKDSYHLIEISNNSQKITLNLPEGSSFNHVKFNLGIDSLTNVSGLYEGDLDPTKGMYWAWQSGYINFKLEGEHPKSTARSNVVQFHLGGYLPGQLAVQSIQLTCQNSNKLALSLNLDEFIRSNDFSVNHTIMSPGESAVLFSQKIALLFVVNED